QRSVPTRHRQVLLHPNCNSLHSGLPRCAKAWTSSPPNSRLVSSKLQAHEQETLRKLTAALSRPAAAPMHKPAPAPTPSVTFRASASDGALVTFGSSALIPM